MLKTESFFSLIDTYCQHFLFFFPSSIYHRPMYVLSSVGIFISYPVLRWPTLRLPLKDLFLSNFTITPLLSIILLMFQIQSFMFCMFQDLLMLSILSLPNSILPAIFLNNLIFAISRGLFVLDIADLVSTVQVTIDLNLTLQILAFVSYYECLWRKTILLRHPDPWLAPATYITNYVFNAFLG